MLEIEVKRRRRMPAMLEFQNKTGSPRITEWRCVGCALSRRPCPERAGWGLKSALWNQLQMHSDARRVCLEQGACLLLIHTETSGGYQKPHQALEAKDKIIELSLSQHMDFYFILSEGITIAFERPSGRESCFPEPNFYFFGYKCAVHSALSLRKPLCRIVTLYHVPKPGWTRNPHVIPAHPV